MTLWNLHGHTSEPEAPQFKGLLSLKEHPHEVSNGGRINGGEEDRTELRIMLPFQPSGLNILHNRDFIYREYMCLYIYISLCGQL